MTMPTHRRYTKRTKMTAVIAAEASSVAEAARQTGIPESNIRYWHDSAEFVELRAKTREERGEMYAALSVKVADAIERRLPEFEPRDLSVLLGILTEKSQLLSGEPTARTENKSITDGLDDHERQALNDAILGELTRRSDARTPEPAVGAPEPEGAEAT